MCVRITARGRDLLAGASRAFHYGRARDDQRNLRKREGEMCMAEMVSKGYLARAVPG